MSVHRKCGAQVEFERQAGELDQLPHNWHQERDA
jgi:hypothetical protein